MILHNVLYNAVKYSDDTKQVCRIKVKIKVWEEETLFSVTDNGLGIAPELKDRIFEMFFRATESSNGSGLGLYIVKETMAKLGGEISVDSTLNEGSCFTLIIPNYAKETVLI